MGGWNEQMGFRHAEFNAPRHKLHNDAIPTWQPSPPQRLNPPLLRAYFARSLAYWISRGRPLLRPPLVLHLPAPHLPPATHPRPTPTPNTSSNLPKISALGNITPNPWLQIIQSALVHPDDHLAKFQRTLAYYGTMYGGVKAGEFRGTELEGGEYVMGRCLCGRRGGRCCGWGG
ncbi:hypothetical protein R3P38DRAFT_3296200 [Favolaschia claudopus]|uniref:Uncharacterized protein n=1 Tax=Favolaschia claudopus TaxID=2862362 RepID=A0AAV9Z9T6_9AGAR